MARSEKLPFFASATLACATLLATAALLSACGADSPVSAKSGYAPKAPAKPKVQTPNPPAPNAPKEAPKPEPDEPEERGSRAPDMSDTTAFVIAEPAPAPDASKVRFDGGVTAFVDVPDERVEADCYVLTGQIRPLEFLIVTEVGATHEALLQLRGRAADLKQGMELLGLREGTRKLQFRGDPSPPDGPPVDLSVRFRDAKGRLCERPIEDWTWNGFTGKAMERGPWVFTGSLSGYRAEVNRSELYADAAGNVVAVWRDPSCVIDNPRASATDDKAYSPNPRAGIPAQGASVTLVVRKHKEKPADRVPPKAAEPVPSKTAEPAAGTPGAAK